MGLRSLISLQLFLVGVLFSTIVAAQMQSKPGCLDKCGNISIPFPFGVGNGCYLNPYFNITCDNSTTSPKTYLRNSSFEVTEINVELGQLNILSRAARDCYGVNSEDEDWYTWFSLAKFTISKLRNKFTVIGCDSYGYLEGYRNGIPYSAGCMTVCNQIDYVDNKSCSGSGCCQIEIPDGLYRANVSAFSFRNHSDVSDFSPCTYAFLVEEGQFNFSRRLLKNISEDEMFPVVLDWSVEKKNTSVAEPCKGNATEYEPANLTGFRCNCKKGYEGNPYLGCHDFDECKSEKLNNCTHHCTNTNGSYNCSCPKWYKGDGRRDGEGCELRTSHIFLLIICAGAIIVVTLVGSSWIYLAIKHKRELKQKERCFRYNGGFMLQQKLSGREGNSGSFKIFKAIELDKATNNYDDNMIIGKGGFGVVYKGILVDKTEVAIKKSKTTEHFEVEQFVNEVLIVSQINHRNVVKLLGCCLETQAPLLVYEFIPGGTLFEHIHQRAKQSSTFPWSMRLKVAAETAIALSYLHFEASVPIVHRDVKTSNILLNPNCTAKVSDFGASKFVPCNEMQISTMVRGTLGYLDPEYLLTSQLTDKSDVYSFGVVLVELLTGLTPLSFERPEAERSLAMYFVLSVKHGCLFDIIDSDLIDQGKDEQLKEVALMAQKCLALKGEERPTMKEVANELEGLLAMDKHPWDQFNSEETQHLLMEQRNFTYGDGASASSTWYNIEISSIGNGR